MSLGRRHYAARVGIFLIAAALLVGMVGCGGMPETGPYKLTIASTLRGSVTTPGEGTFTYDEGTMVNLAAEAEEGYRFLEWTGDVDTIADVNAATTTITINGKYDITAHFGWPNIIITQVAAGGHHTVGLREDGTVVAVGDNSEGQCDIDGWTDIKKIAAGAKHTAGLKEDGTVIAVGENYHGQCNVVGWTDIIQINAGRYNTVGLKEDGTVVVAGKSIGGPPWTDIKQVAVGNFHMVGLKTDGTVVAVGENSAGQCNVDGWTGITQVAAGPLHTVGLKSDGSVVAVGWNYADMCDEASSWTDIVQVSASSSGLYKAHTVGLGEDGTVLAAGANAEGQCDVSGWTGITQVTAGEEHTVGLKQDGSVVALGDNSEGQCDVGN
jgi:alpha-tubulin suppressor-like RCC1 family protein